jgi:3-oxoacyl-[acyl-carrier protein] reductase
LRIEQGQFPADAAKGLAMDLGLNGKTVLITGGSKGIGRAAADVLAAEGCHLVLVARSGGDLEVARTALRRQANIRVDVVAADLSDGGSVRDLAARFPDIDVLVNNAGAIPGGNLLEIDEPTWRSAWDLKVFGYINMCRAFYDLMIRRGRGVIVNVIGAAALTRDPDYICGATGNAALVAFTQSLGSASVRAGVRVVGINPGPVATDRLVTLYRKKAQSGGLDPESWRELLKPLPFGRAATPQEIAAAIAFLASERSGYTSGSVIAIDAGISARSQ